MKSRAIEPDPTEVEALPAAAQQAVFAPFLVVFEAIAKVVSWVKGLFFSATASSTAIC